MDMAAIKKHRKTILKAIGTLVAIGLLFFLLINNTSPEDWEAVKNISKWSLAGAALLVVGSRIFITLRWYVYLRTGGVEISFKETLSLVFMGLFSNNFLPTTIGGDVVKLAGATQYGYDNALILASIAADRVTNMLGMSLAAPLGLIQLVPAGAPLGSFVLPAFAKKVLVFLKKTFYSFSLWFKKPYAIALALAFASLHMLCSYGAYYTLIIGAGEYLELWKVIGLASLAYFVTLVPISINGYGVAELTTTYLLSEIGGVSYPVSLSVAIIHRLFMILVSTPGALYLPGIIGKLSDSAGKEN